MKYFASLVAASAVVLACSSSSPTTAVGKGGAGANPDTFVQAICNFLQKCNPNNVKRLYGDLPGCVAKQTPIITTTFHANGNTITQPQVEACASKIGADCTLLVDAIPECEFKGSVQENAPCVYNSQCASGSCFKTDESPTCGTCKSKVALGASCAANDCTLGLFCQQTGDSAYTCVEPVHNEGDACNDTDKPCIDSLNCTDGKCAKLIAEGAPCNDDKEQSCDYDLACLQPAAGGGTVCQKLLSAPLGGKCGFDTTAKTVTECEGSTCSNLTENGTCVPFLQKGAACTFEGASCEPGLACDGGVCTNQNDEATCH